MDFLKSCLPHFKTRRRRKRRRGVQIGKGEEKNKIPCFSHIGNPESNTYIYYTYTRVHIRAHMKIDEGLLAGGRTCERGQQGRVERRVGATNKVEQ